MSPWKRAALGAVAVAQVFTATTRYCPVNELLGVDNCPDDEVWPGDKVAG